MDLFLFHRTIETSIEALEAGVDGVIVDLESAGKARRQEGYDTEINTHSFETLEALRQACGGYILCRISGPEPEEFELERIVDLGADEIIVPMLTSVRQAERLFDMVGSSCQVTLMVETPQAVQNIEALCKLPAARIYVGLNDLRILRGTETIFTPLVDGVMGELRCKILDQQFGFGGLTLPDKGHPLAAMHLYREMARLGSGFTFLRRSFYRDCEGMTLKSAVTKIRAGLKAVSSRDPIHIQTDYQALREAILTLTESHRDLI